MAISEERWKVRTRMLEERVNALSKQLASERENSGRLHIEHQESTAKIQALEEDLRAERNRCHKLSVSLSSCRRTNREYKEKLCCSSANDRPPQHYNNYSGCTKEYCSHSAVCCDCMVSPSHFIMNGAEDALIRINHHPNDSRNSNPHHHCMGIKPAPLNPRSSFPRKVKAATRPISRNHLTKHGDDNSNRELRACRLLQLINDKTQIPGCHCGSSEQASPMSCIHCGQMIMSNQAIVSLRTSGLNHVVSTTGDEIGTMKSEDLTKMVKSDHEKQGQKDDNKFAGTKRELAIIEHEARRDSGINNSDKNKDEEAIKKGDNCIDLEVLKAENEALRKALLSGKIMEIKELEKQLQNVKQLHPTTKNYPQPTCMTESRDVENLRNWSIHSDPVKYLDTVKIAEDEILEKRMSALGLEGGLATQLTSLITSPHANYSPNHHPNFNEDLRHLLKALARDVVLLRKENEWLKTRFQV